MGGYVLTNRAAAEVEQLLRGQGGIWFEPEPARLAELFPAVGESEEPHSQWWTDAYLAAFAIAANHELATFDRGFARYEAQGLRWNLLELGGGAVPRNA